MRQILDKSLQKEAIQDLLDRGKALVIPIETLWEILQEKIDFHRDAFPEDTVAVDLFFMQDRNAIALKLCSKEFEKNPEGAAPPEIILRIRRRKDHES